jgi:3-oxoadipate enol-lactonase
MLAGCPLDGYLGCCGAMRDEDLRHAIGAISCPVLAIGGRADAATPPEGVEFIHQKIAGSTLVMLDSAHLSNVERAAEFNRALAEHLRS